MQRKTSNKFNGGLDSGNKKTVTFNVIEDSSSSDSNSSEDFEILNLEETKDKLKKVKIHLRDDLKKYYVQ